MALYSCTRTKQAAAGLAKTGTDVFFKVEKNMIVTPVFYLGAERSRFTITP